MTLRLMAEMDQDTARMFEEETEHRIQNDFILRPEEMKGEKLLRLTHLEHVGLLQHVLPMAGVAWTKSLNSDGFVTIIEGNYCLRLRQDNEVQLGVIPLTRVGKEVASLLAPVDEMTVLKRLGDQLHSKARSMDLHRVSRNQNGQEVLVPIPVEVLKSEVEGG